MLSDFQELEINNKNLIKASKRLEKAFDNLEIAILDELNTLQENKEIISFSNFNKINESHNFILEIEGLYDRMYNRISDLVSEKGEESDFSNKMVIKIGDELSIDLNDGYVAEVSDNVLISNDGLEYNFDVISLNDLADLIAYIEEK